MVWTRSKRETLALPVDALALLILRDYHQVRGWNWHSWMLESEHNGSARDQETKDALAEGWAWIIAHGLVMRDTTQTSTEAVKPTRLGHETLKYGVARLAAAERLGVALHPRLALPHSAAAGSSIARSGSSSSSCSASTSWPSSPP